MRLIQMLKLNGDFVAFNPDAVTFLSPAMGSRGRDDWQGTHIHLQGGVRFTVGNSQEEIAEICAMSPGMFREEVVQ